MEKNFDAAAAPVDVPAALRTALGKGALGLTLKNSLQIVASRGTRRYSHVSDEAGRLVHALVVHGAAQLAVQGGGGSTFQITAENVRGWASSTISLSLGAILGDLLSEWDEVDKARRLCERGERTLSWAEASPSSLAGRREIPAALP